MRRLLLHYAVSRPARGPPPSHEWCAAVSSSTRPPFHPVQSGAARLREPCSCGGDGSGRDGLTEALGGQPIGAGGCRALPLSVGRAAAAAGRDERRLTARWCRAEPASLCAVVSAHATRRRGDGSCPAAAAGSASSTRGYGSCCARVELASGQFRRRRQRERLGAGGSPRADIRAGGAAARSRRAWCAEGWRCTGRRTRLTPR